MKATALRHRINPLIAGIWLIFAIFVGYLLVIIWTARATEIERLRGNALSLTRLVAEHANSTFHLANLILLDAESHMPASDYVDAKNITERRKNEIQQMLMRHVNRGHGLISMSVTDADGQVFASSTGVPAGLNLADRPYFQALKAEPRTTPIISDALKGRISNRWGIPLARRISFADGSFAGMIVVNIGLAESFENFYKTVSLEGNGLITLRDTGNKIVVRYPVVEDRLNTVLTGSPAAKAMLTGQSELVVDSISPIDQIERVVALRRLTDYPLYASVGLSKNAGFSALRQQAWIALCVLCALFAAAWLCTTTIKRRDAAALALTKSHDDLKETHAQLEQLRQQLETSNTSISSALSQAENKASHDELTGLWNRRMFNQRLGESIARAKRLGMSFSLLIVDLDHFKNINDDYGHLVGDQVLMEFALVIGQRIRETDFFARWGGEEFMLLLDATDSQRATDVAEELRIAISEHYFPSIGWLTASIGIAEYHPDLDHHQILARADQSLYAAKSQGRNQVVAAAAMC